MASDSIDKLAKMLAEELPQSLKSVRDDLEENFRSVLRSGLARLDLVTREEFEVQEAVLKRTREKLEAMVARLEELEAGTSIGRAGGTKAKKKPAAKKSKKKTVGKAGRKGAKKNPRR